MQSILTLKKGKKSLWPFGITLLSKFIVIVIPAYIYDGHGSSRLLTNEAGRITDRYDYDACGNLLKKEGDTENDFLYTGEQYNANTGLYYLRARYMDPSTGTFISMDSYQGSLYDPVNLHKYLYANANPVMYTDPTGYFSLAEFSIADGIQSTLNSMHQLNSLRNIIKWANAMTTVYDTAIEIRDVIFGEKSVADVIGALLKGVVVGFMCDGMCKTALGVVLKPMMAIFGLGSQVDQIQEALKSGDPAEIAVRFVQLVCMLFGLTSQCFTGDTLVSTDEGLVPIEDIEIGDYVWSENTETGEKELKKVLSVSVTETDVLVHVTTENGTVINTTENHPFYVEGKGWCAAAELEDGDVLRTQDGETETVEGVQIEQLNEAVKVYNLEIEDSHTYYVSADEVLVHNECGDTPLEGTGKYKDEKGHHVHAKAAFSGDSNYNANEAFSISQQFMEENNLDHGAMTKKQRELFKELFESKEANTLEKHNSIAKQVLMAGGASEELADKLVSLSINNLFEQNVDVPSRIPWYTKD